MKMKCCERCKWFIFYGENCLKDCNKLNGAYHYSFMNQDEIEIFNFFTNKIKIDSEKIGRLIKKLENLLNNKKLQYSVVISDEKIRELQKDRDFWRAQYNESVIVINELFNILTEKQKDELKRRSRMVEQIEMNMKKIK